MLIDGYTNDEYLLCSLLKPVSSRCVPSPVAATTHPSLYKTTNANFNQSYTDSYNQYN